MVAQNFADAINVAMPRRAVVVRPAWKGHRDLTRLFLDKDPQLSALVLDWLRTLRREG